MQLFEPDSTKLQARSLRLFTFVFLALCLAPAGLAKTTDAPVVESKTAGVEVSESTDKRTRLLNQVVAPSYQTPTPEAAKVRQEIMDDLEHKSEAEPMSYYPI
jgi:hypothetical protein